jgi:acetate kinase
MNVLVLNCGSSSLKFQIIATDPERISQNTDQHLASGSIERIGSEAIITLRSTNKPPNTTTAPIRNHHSAIEYVLNWVCSNQSMIEGINSLANISAVGHRIVHGGEQFTKSVVIDEKVLRGIEDCIELAPLHNPANIKGIQAAQSILGTNVPHVAVFDTAFHQSLPPHAYLYAIPYQFYRRHRIRRYGFHGTSHRYVAYRYRLLRNSPRDQTNIITLHLGNGCSAAAIKAGRSIDTSMGLTPLEGLIMGTRSGDIDPTIVDFLAVKEGLSTNEIETLLNKQSGLVGISGLTNDMRDLLAEVQENDDRRAKLAIAMFCYRVRKYIGAYLAAMGGADAIVFTGGIGQNSSELRSMICQDLEWFGVKLDQELNRMMIEGREGIISKDDSRLTIYVIPTDEELLIARDTVRCVLNLPQPN